MLCSFRTYYSGDKTVPESHRMFLMCLCHIYTFNYLQYYKILYIILYFPILILLFLICQRNFIVKSCNFSQNFHRCFVYIFSSVCIKFEYFPTGHLSKIVLYLLYHYITERRIRFEINKQHITCS